MRALRMAGVPLATACAVTQAAAAGTVVNGDFFTCCVHAPGWYCQGQRVGKSLADAQACSIWLMTKGTGLRMVLATGE